jgi:hypothetical protein
LAAAALAAIVSAFLIRTVVPSAGTLTHGFLAYYAAGQAIKDGEPGARLYDEQWFSARVAALSGGRVYDIYFVNTPVLAVSWLPLAYLPVESARRLWLGLSTLALALSIAILASQFGWSRQLPGIAALTALFTLPTPVREQFNLGQMYAILLLLHMTGWQAYARRKDAVTGIVLGLAMALKLSGWPIGVLLIARRRWKALTWSIVTGAVAAVMSLPWVGIDSWRTLLLVTIPEAVQSPFAALPAYQDTTGFWQHLLRYDAHWNPNPIVDAPALAGVLTMATTVAACVALVLRPRPAHVSFAAAVALIELLSPFAEQFHYLLLMLPVAVLWQQTWLLRSAGALCTAFVASLLIACPIDYQLSQSGWAVLLNYPRLLGGWIAFVALLIPWRERSAASGIRKH